MGKALKQRKLFEGSASRMLLVASLSVSLAAVGCTTDRHLGNGVPTRSEPMIRTAPTAGVTSGTETAPLPVPMTSSYSRPETILPPTADGAPVMSASDRAAAIMARHELARGRVIGPAMPQAVDQPYVSDAIGTGNFTWPALQTNPQLTINSSISSPATTAIISGAGGNGIGNGAGAVIGSVNAPGFTGAVLSPGTVVGGTPGAVVFSPSGRPVTTPSPVPLATPAARPLTVPAATAINPAGAGTIDRANATADSIRSRAVNAGATTGASPVRIVTGTDGRVTITNSGGDQ